jgi:hypothetical protein
MPLDIILAGKERSKNAIQVLIGDPLKAIGLVAGAILAVLVMPLWGGVHPWSGWQKCRDRLPTDGLEALGEVLVPDRALEDYKDGIFRGFFRVHASTASFLLLQAPILWVLLVPSDLAEGLFRPVGDAYAFNHDLASFFYNGVPMLFAFAAVIILVGQSLLAVRILGRARAPHPIGTTFAAVGAAWKQTLKDPRPLVSIGILTALIGIAGKIFATLNDRAAEELHLQGSNAPGVWIMLALLIIVGAVLLESLGRWSEENTVELAPANAPYSIVEKITQEEIPAGIQWLRDAAVRFVELTGLVIVLYFLAYTTMELFYLVKHREDANAELGDWRFLAWFIVAAGLLIYLRILSTRNSAPSSNDQGAA